MTQNTHYDLAISANKSYDTYTFSIHECEVLVELKNQEQIVAIRGTEGGALISGLGFMDIIRDMRFIPWYHPILGWAHSGFMKGALKIYEDLTEHIIKDVPIRITGHSLGAAMALVVGILLKHDGYKLVEYVGFACPRTFVYNKQKHNPDLSVRFPITIYRYQDDIVPIVPFAFPFNYHHPVKMTQIGDGNGLPSLIDHSMNNYIDAMRYLPND